VLKPTSRLLNGWNIFALGWLALAGALALHGTPVDAAQPASSLSAPAADGGEQLRQQAAELLRRARQAIAANDLAKANELTGQAEGLQAHYPMFYRGDTPQAVRRELDQRTQAARGDNPARPSLLATPGSPRSVPQADPFAGHVGGSILSAPGGVTPLPRVEPNPVRPLASDDPTGNPMPFGRIPSGTPGAGDITSPTSPHAYPTAGAGASMPVAAMGKPGSDLLREARKALAVGDVRRAGALTQQAAATPANYDPLDDSPEKVELAIRKYQEVTSQQNNSEGYRRTYARMLMEQADALIRSGDIAEAEQLATLAARQNLTYSPMESTPQVLLQRIAAARRNAASPSAPGMAMASGTPERASAPANTGMPAGLSADLGSPRHKAVDLARQAREALRAGQLAWAEELAKQAELMNLPEATYPPNDRPGLILLEVRNAKLRETSGVVQASNNQVIPAGGTAEIDRTAARAVYDPANDRTRNTPASHAEGYRPPMGSSIDMAQIPTPLSGGSPTLAPTAPATEGNASESQGMILFRRGEEALRARQSEQAYELFRQAAPFMNDMDPTAAQQLQDRLQLLTPPNVNRNAGPRSLVDETTAKQAILYRQLASEISQADINARKKVTTDSKAALEGLETVKKRLESEPLDSASRDQLMRRVDRALTEVNQYISQNRPRIELDEKNRAVREDLDREQRTKREVQDKLALKINEFNTLCQEQRYAEAEVIAKQCVELAPDEPVAQQVAFHAKMLRSYMNNRMLASDKERGFFDALSSVEESGIPYDDRNPFSFGDIKKWKELTKDRKKLMAEHSRRRSEREIEIERRLRNPVSLQFTNTPLSKVLEHLGKITDINIHIDPKGFAEQGVTTDQPVTIDLRQEIMLKSALSLILEPLQLSYVIKNEVLTVTSEQARDGQVYTFTYNVADLVIPIPNFVPNPDAGLGGAYKTAMANATFGNGVAPWGANNAPLTVVASRDGKQASGMINPAVLTQNMSNPMSGTGGVPMGGGPGGLGGGPQADFDSLINLITSTVAPTTWDDVGGPGSIAPFETNLSIVVSQTQAVHEQIVDLLEQLRRLQDLQVTIEVRFLTLNDNFFERIGVDFDFDIDDNASPNKSWISRFEATQTSGQLPTIENVDVDNDNGKNLTVGMSAPGVFSADLDIPMRQNSFGLGVPQFGGFDPSAGAQIGFAILSDIEAYFFINAAQGDTRTNVLQAPKVTLFNGQQAFISDSSTTPFVISVIPVVGDFAAAQQPVIVVLSEGTHMTVQAVVSNDRRFVRLTVVPFFSKIGEVNTFQFTGTESTTTDTSNEGWVNPTDPNDNRRDNNANTTTRTRSGTAVQLPTFSFVTVTTTVSVPDGGTVLLGGIKRLSEGRSEFGVPILNKVPFINRLFKNVGIGRETQSLMMMVTPRIIIQEEEEQKLGID
jgi:general secretion pathway protein D